MDDDKTVTLYTYTDETEAILMQYKLSEIGITSFLKEENVMGLDPMGGVELRIFVTDAAAARELLMNKLAD